MKMLSFIHQKGCKGIVAMKKMTEIKGHGMMELFKPYCISVQFISNDIYISLLIL